MHVVPESAEVSSCGLRNISRLVVHIVCSGARVKKIADVRTIYRLRTFNSSKRGSLRLAPIIYRLRTFNSSMWGSLRLAPTSDMQDMMSLTSQLSYVFYSTEPCHASPGVDRKDHSLRS